MDRNQPPAMKPYLSVPDPASSDCVFEAVGLKKEYDEGQVQALRGKFPRSKHQDHQLRPLTY